MHHEVGGGQTLSPARLGGHAAAGVGLLHTPADEPGEGHLLGAVDDHHAGHVVRVHPHLHQERHDEDHDPVGLLQRHQAFPHGGSYRGMDDGIEVGQCLRVGEHDRGERRTVERTVGPNHGRAEALEHGPVGGCARLHDLTGDQVGVDHHRATVGELGGNRGLARADASGEPDHEHPARPYHRVIKPDPRLFSLRADERLEAARNVNKRVRKAVLERAGSWPAYSPGAVNAWLLLVTTKPPSWEDNLIPWKERPLTLGEAHENFFYPDPLGFWAEVRAWALQLVRLQQPAWSTPDVLSLAMLLHADDQPDRFRRAMELCVPQAVVFLDEPSWERSGLHVSRVPHYITDPHRAKQVYEGFWGTTPEGLVVGKAPQHPTMHRLYRREDMTSFLRSAPISA